MDKDQLVHLCKNYTSLTPGEAHELEELVRQYPYSQLARILSARANSLNRLEASQESLHMAAVYATDRSVLKRVITAAPTMRKEPVHISAPTEGIPETAVPEIPLESGGELAERVMADLEALKESKHNFEMMLERFGKHANEGSSDKTMPTGRPSKKKETSTQEGLIEEIKSSKKKVKTSEIKHKDQIEIINQFIKTQPSIGKTNSEVEDDASDLSEKSNALGDHLVSETLVEILLKQGKKDKAIEMLRKLIWKFPQKKAYFAAQIEKLK